MPQPLSRPGSTGSRSNGDSGNNRGGHWSFIGDGDKRMAQKRQFYPHRAEQEGYDANFDAPLAELNPAVNLFQQLTIRKWEEHLARQA